MAACGNGSLRLFDLNLEVSDFFINWSATLKLQGLGPSGEEVA